MDCTEVPAVHHGLSIMTEQPAVGTAWCVQKQSFVCLYLIWSRCLP